jgi:hypothetical protein
VEREVADADVFAISAHPIGRLVDRPVEKRRRLPQIGLVPIRLNQIQRREIVAASSDT